MTESPEAQFWFGTVRSVVAAAVLAMLWISEGIAPMFVGRTRRVGHAARHIGLAAINAVVHAVIFAGLLLASSEWARTHSVGLLRLAPLAPWLHAVLSLVCIDAWQYAWHRLNHTIPVLWRFHAVHHSDTVLDASSGLRFHTGEIALSATARAVVIPVLGVTIGHVALYELIVTPIVLFHHSNIRLPARIDRLLRVVIVTPWMHWVHHSRIRPETNSNYASGLSVWDRIFGTFRVREEPRTIDLGLDGYDAVRSATLVGMLRSPLQPTPRSTNDDPTGAHDGSGC